MQRFKSIVGQQKKIAVGRGKTFEVISNTAIPKGLKKWFKKKRIEFTELID